MTWNGATLYKSADGGSTYDAVLTSTTAATIGIAAGVLGDFAGGNIFDEINSVSVVLRSGSPLVSYTELQVLNGAGLCVIGAAGRWEVLQYKTATLTAANTYTLSGLLRGRRGTEWAMGRHQAGDTFVLASVAAWDRSNPGTAEIGLARLYKGVTSKTSVSAATAQSFTNAAMGLKPYSPVQIGMGRDADGNVTINWIRRTRIGGEWRDYVDVPLGETSEAYTVEIYDDADHTTLIRTISVTSPTAEYSAADQTADFGSPQATVYARVLQLSGATGPGAVTVTPTPTPVPTVPAGASTVGPLISTFTPSGPITLTSGMTVTGLWITNPSGPGITGDGVSNVHIYNNKITDCGPTSSDSGIDINNASDIHIEHNSFDNVATAVLISNSTDNIVVDYNYATRIRGPYPRGQLVQFNAVVGSGNSIMHNVSDQTAPGYGNGTEDHINTWLSSGTSGSPLIIKYNKLRGGGPSTSGGGIIAGDGGGNYITVDSNNLVNCGQYGISIAGGHDNKLLNNKVYSAAFAWTNVGAFVWNQYAPSAYNEEVSGNRVNWKKSDGTANNWWDGGNSGAIIMTGNVFGDTTIGPDIWDEVFP